MKYVKLVNLTANRLSFSGLRDGNGRPLRIEPQGFALVHPQVPKHSKVKGLVGTMLKVVEPGKKVEVSAQKAPVKEKPKVKAPVDKKSEEKSEKKPEKSEDDNEDKVQDTSEWYLEAPGITEKNVDAVREKFPTSDDLAAAKERELVDCGVQKSFAGRVIEWAQQDSD